MELVNFKVGFSNFNPIKAQRSILLNHFKIKDIYVSKNDIGKLLSKAYGTELTSVSTIPYQHMTKDQKLTVKKQFENIIMENYSDNFTGLEWSDIFKELHNVVERNFDIPLGNLMGNPIGLNRFDINKSIITICGQNKVDPILHKITHNKSYKSPIFLSLDQLSESEKNVYRSQGYSVYDMNNEDIAMDLLGSLKSIVAIAFSLAAMERDYLGAKHISDDTLDDIYSYLASLETKKIALNSLNIFREIDDYAFEFDNTKNTLDLLKHEIIIPLRMNSKQSKTFIDDLLKNRNIVIAINNNSVPNLFFKRLMLINIRNYMSLQWKDNDIRYKYTYTCYYQNYQDYYLPGFSVVISQFKALNMGHIFNIDKEITTESCDDLRALAEGSYATLVLDKDIYYRIAATEGSNVYDSSLKDGNIGITGQYSVDLQSEFIDSKVRTALGPLEFEQRKIVFEIVNSGIGDIALENLNPKMISQLSKIYKIDLKSKIAKMDELNSMKDQAIRDTVAKFKHSKSTAEEGSFMGSLMPDGKIRGQRIIQISR